MTTVILLLGPFSETNYFSKLGFLYLSTSFELFENENSIRKFAHLLAQHYCCLIWYLCTSVSSISHRLLLNNYYYCCRFTAKPMICHFAYSIWGMPRSSSNPVPSVQISTVFVREEEVRVRHFLVVPPVFIPIFCAHRIERWAGCTKTR